MTTLAQTPAFYRIALISRNVSNLARAVDFYHQRLGFLIDGPAYVIDDAYRRLLGLPTPAVMARRLSYGAQTIELVEVGCAGRPYVLPEHGISLAFQHFALRCADIDASCRRLFAPGPAAQARAITLAQGPGGSGAAFPTPVQLPQASGGARAFKFCDPDGHALELIKLPQFEELRPDPGLQDLQDLQDPQGIDHCAICVADVDISLAFYARRFGFQLQNRQQNRGGEQACLDGLNAASVAVEVVALSSANSKPHLELLSYVNPLASAALANAAPADIASDRLVLRRISRPREKVHSGAANDDCSADLNEIFSRNDGGQAIGAASHVGSTLLQDPDGHWLMVMAD